MRDLNERIKAKAESLVSANVVSKEVSAQTVANERAIVDANAKVNESLVNDLVNAKTAVSERQTIASHVAGT